MSSPLLLLTIMFSLIGLADASYLTYEEVINKHAPCVPLPWFDCGAVLNSPWAKIGPVPLAALGILFYACILSGAMYLYLRPQASIWLKRLFFASATSGFLFSLFLVYLQVAIIQAICFFCMISAATSTVVFLSLLPQYFSWEKRKKRDQVSS